MPTDVHSLALAATADRGSAIGDRGRMRRSGERQQADECPLAGARGYRRKAKNQHCGDGPEPIARPCSQQSLR